MLRGFESALDKRLIDDNLGGDIRQFTSLPGLYLLAHRLEVALHPVDTHRDAVDQEYVEYVTATGIAGYLREGNPWCGHWDARSGFGAVRDCHAQLVEE